MDEGTSALRGRLDRYAPTGEDEVADVGRVRELVRAGTPWDRSLPLHVTASALVVHPSTGRVLLRWHERQQAWLQVGGHGDPGEDDPLAVALREGREETGLTDLRAWPDDSLRHVAVVPVPASEREPAHEHADLRFLLATDRPDDVQPERPSAALRWVDVPTALTLTTEENVRETIRRAASLFDPAPPSRSAVPFAGLRPAPGRAHAAWVVEAMAGRSGVALVVPDGFESYVRIHHRIHSGQTWREFAPEYLVRGTEMYEYVGSKLESIDGDGNLDADVVDALVPLLAAATSTPDDCHFALWGGWGWVLPSPTSTADVAPAPATVHSFSASCPVEPWWGGRDMILFDGPIEAVSQIGHTDPFAHALWRQSPQWWWPDDRAWFVGTEIDFAWTYVGGPRSLVDAILALPDCESVRIEPTDRW